MQTQLQVFTFRDGLLARLAHDLRLTLEAFELRLEHGRLEGWFELASLRVDGVAHGDRVDPDALSSDDKSRIHDNLTREVLETAHFPRATLEAQIRRDAAGFAIAGQLQLHGREQPLTATARLGALGATVEVELRPSSFGIAPFRALGGAIRLQDRVRIRVEVITARDMLEAICASGGAATFAPL